MANSLLAKHYEAQGNFKEAAVNYEKLGTINDWQIVGTFDNTSGSGFNKDFGVLANPKEDAVFKNKVNADVKWFKPPHVRSDRWFDFNYYFSIGNSIIDKKITFNQTFVVTKNKFFVGRFSQMSFNPNSFLCPCIWIAPRWCT
jgi:hypothetical protein